MNEANTQACRCENCAGATCQCGCQHVAKPVESCRCGSECRCGAACRCEKA